MVRIALIADTHGNLISLDAVLEDLSDQNVDQMICLGDVAGLGPQPRETIDRLRSLGCPVVMGNADQFLLDPGFLDPTNHPDADESLLRMHEMEMWCRAQLQPQDLDFLRTFQSTVEVPLGDDRTLLCYHGSPRSADEQIRASTPDDELAEKLGDRRTLVMAGGHTHEQFLRRLNQTIVINPGSVGLPYEILGKDDARNPPWAEYALLTVQDGGISVDLRRVPVDAASIRRALLDCGAPHAAWWANDWW